MLRVVILGYGEMLSNLIAGTLDSGSQLVGVFRYDRVRKSRFKRWLDDLFNPAVDYNYIKSYKIDEIKATSANSEQFRNMLMKLKPDVVLVGSWGERIEKATFMIPRLATINVHPSLLPKYRGPNPYLQTIKHCETQSGISFHLMDENFDTGSILRQSIVEIAPDDTGKELKERTVLIARLEICELLKSLDEDLIIPLSQDESKASYYSQIESLDTMLDFSKTADEVSAHIRALHPWSKAYFCYGGEFFVANPYHIEVLENKTDINDCGIILAKNPKEKSLIITCANNSMIKLSRVNLYGNYIKFLTGLFIKYRIKIYDRVY